MSEPLVLVTNDGAVRTLTLNRPKALNSFTAAMHAELRTALDAAAADAGVRCVVLTGAGRGFCAGQDLNDEGMGVNGQANDVQGVVERHYRPLVLAIRAMPVPVLAMVNGVAAGAGANIALACDMVLAARSASFIQAFSKIGLVPDAGGTWLLPRLVGRARAIGLAYTGDKLSAEDALAWGLVWACVDDAALAGHTQALAQRLAAMPSAALVATRRLLDESPLQSMADALASEAVAQGRLSRAHDYPEGVAAFLEKRAAVFTDR
jgi:2-(1,2-epoxy-1,2-dihydrophenyl)acetyl-CoA isomerase